MINFDYENLQFLESKEKEIEFKVYFKQNEDYPISINSLFAEISAIENIYYKNELLDAIYLYTKVKPNDELIILGKDSYPIKKSTQLVDNILDFENNINTFCNYHEIISIKPSKRVLEMNYLLYIYNQVHNTNFELIGKKSDNITPPRLARTYREYKNDTKYKHNDDLLLKHAFKFIIKSLNIPIYKKFYTFLNIYLKENEISYQTFDQFVKNYIRNTRKNKKDYIDFAIIGCFRKAISQYSYFFKNDEKIYSKYGNIYESSRKYFSNRLMNLDRPIIAVVKPDGKFKVFCINHLIDKRHNANNIILSKYNKNSPGLFELTVVMGFIALFIRLGREGAEHKMRMAIYETEYENAQLRNEILKNTVNKNNEDRAEATLKLKKFLTDPKNKLDISAEEIKNFLDPSEILDFYDKFLDEHDLIFDYSNNNFGLIDLKKQKEETHKKIMDLVLESDFSLQLALGRIRY